MSSTNNKQTIEDATPKQRAIMTRWFEEMGGCRGHGASSRRRR